MTRIDYGMDYWPRVLYSVHREASAVGQDTGQACVAGVRKELGSAGRCGTQQQPYKHLMGSHGQKGTGPEEHSLRVADLGCYPTRSI